MFDQKEKAQDDSDDGSEGLRQGAPPRKPKTTIACDRCRVKKRKCDGNRPSCRHCRLAESPCVYPEKPRQRGPVAGYAKEIEKRISWLEGFILFVDSTISQTEGIPSEARYRLDLRSLTQVYIEQNMDRDAEDWAQVRGRFQESFASLTEVAKEGFELSKSSRGRKRSFSHLIDGTPSLQSAPDLDHSRPSMESQSRSRYSAGSRADKTVSHPELLAEQPYPPPPTFTRRFATPSMQDPMNDFQPQDLLALSQPYLHSQARPPPHSYGPPIPPMGSTSSNFGERMASPRYSQPINALSWNDLQRDQRNPAPHFSDNSINLPASAAAPTPFAEQTPFNPDASTFSTSISRQAFDLDYSSNLRRELDVEDVLRIGEISGDSLQIQLPPPELQAHLIGLYLDHMDSQLPFVDVDALRAYVSSISTKSPKRQETSPNRLLVLAICAYASCCSSASRAVTADNGIFLTSVTSDSLGEIWAGEARNFLMSSSLRRRCDIETIHGMMILVMRDMGCAQYFQAWLWLGIAVRVSQDNGLHVLPTQRGSASGGNQYGEIFRNTWAALGLLDVTLSLQLNRPTAIDFSLYEQCSSANGSAKDRSTGFAPPSIDEPLLQLCGHLNDVRKMYAASAQETTKLAEIRDALQNWKRQLSFDFQLHYGEDQSPVVVTMHMIYHVAIVLLHRPFQNFTGVDTVRPISTATAAFKMLLDAIRLPASGETRLQFSPILIYPLYTIAIALITSERRAGREQTSSATLTRQASLSACLETLEEMSVTWPLAKRCHKILGRLSQNDKDHPESFVNQDTFASHPQSQQAPLLTAHPDDLSAFALLSASLPTIGFGGDSEQDDLLTLLMTNDWSVDNNGGRSGDSSMHHSILPGPA